MSLKRETRVRDRSRSSRLRCWSSPWSSGRVRRTEVGKPPITTRSGKSQPTATPPRSAPDDKDKKGGDQARQAEEARRTGRDSTGSLAKIPSGLEVPKPPETTRRWVPDDRARPGSLPDDGRLRQAGRRPRRARDSFRRPGQGPESRPTSAMTPRRRCRLRKARRPSSAGRGRVATPSRHRLADRPRRPRSSCPANPGRHRCQTRPPPPIRPSLNAGTLKPAGDRGQSGPDPMHRAPARTPCADPPVMNSPVEPGPGDLGGGRDDPDAFSGAAPDHGRVPRSRLAPVEVLDRRSPPPTPITSSGPAPMSTSRRPDHCRRPGRLSRRRLKASTAGALGAGWIMIPSGGRRIAGSYPDRLDPGRSPGRSPPRIADGPRAVVDSDARPIRSNRLFTWSEPGENFWTISKLYYHSGRFYRALHAANRKQVPDIRQLYVGTVLRIPPPEALDRSLIDPPGGRAPTTRRPRP